MDCETTWKNGFVKIYIDSVDMNGHHLLNAHELEQTPEDGKGQESLICCSPWGRRVGHDLAAEQQQTGLLQK